MRARMLVAGALACAGCVKNVLPDANTGEDGTYDGADSITLDPQTHKGEVEDTVSYPGGDRVDWWTVDVPPGPGGSLVVDLSWTGPRPGRDLAFKVYDEWGRDLGGAGPKTEAAARRSRRMHAKKSATVGPTHSTTFYIEVYASFRADAADYRLKVKYEEIYVPPPPPDVPIPMPPRLAVVPPDTTSGPTPPPVPCNKDAPDYTNPSCAGVCDPKALDRDNPDCDSHFPACDTAHLDPGNPHCDDKMPDPVMAEIVHTEKADTGTKITIDIGSTDGVDKTWTGVILDAQGAAIAGGDFTVTEVKKAACSAKVKAAKSLVDKNLQVKLQPPRPVAAPAVP